MAPDGWILARFFFAILGLDRVIRIFGSMLVRPLKTRMRLNRRLPRLGGTGIGIGTDIYMHVSSDDVERIVF